MKKALLFTLVFIAAVTIAFAGTPRPYLQKCALDTGLEAPVTNVGNTTSPDYILTADILETPGEMVTSQNPAPDGYTYQDATQIRIYRAGSGGNFYTATFLQLGTFATQWMAGQTVQMSVTHVATAETATWSIVIPAGTTVINIQTPQVIPPATVATATYTVNMSTNPVGYITPTMLGPTTDVTTLYGTYTPDPMPAPATGYWTPASLIIDAATVWTADGANWVLNQEFVWTEVNTYSYTLYVNGPDGIIVTGPQGGFAMDYSVNSDVQANLLGMYTADAAPAGWEWVMNPIEVTADDWTLVTKKGEVNGTRTSSPKTHKAYEKTIEFVLQELPPTYDYPQGTPVVITVGTVQVDGGNGNDVPGGMIPPVPNGAFVPEYSAVYELVGAGPWTITFATTQPWGAWYSYTSGSWMMVPNIGGFITFVIPAGGKDVPMVPIVLGPVDPTLPVELSSFTAVLTANNFVKLTWVSQSETEMLGYRVYRGESGDQASAIMITPTMIGATNTSTTQSYSITDNEVSIGSTYWYWLESVDYASSHFHGPVSIIVEGEVPPVLPEVTSMKNAYPNPFRMNSSTNIEVAVKAGENGIVTVYNILGQAVKTFKVSEGTTKINWNGRDAKGNACGSGIYFYKLSTPSMNQTKKMVIVK